MNEETVVNTHVPYLFVLPLEPKTLPNIVCHNLIFITQGTVSFWEFQCTGEDDQTKWFTNGAPTGGEEASPVTDWWA